MSTSFVQGYSKATNGLFDIKVCSQTPNICGVQTNQYKFKNNYPAEQLFPFPATTSNDYFFVYDRVAQDSSSLTTFLNLSNRKQNCFDIDPCDIHVAKWCCAASNVNNTTTSISNETKKDNDIKVTQEDVSDSTMILFFVLFGVIFLIIIIYLCFLL